MRLLVCGSRYLTRGLHLQAMSEALRKVLPQPGVRVTLIHGDAEGADRFSEEALRLAWGEDFWVERFPADWKRHGRAAGPLRNARMLSEGRPDFWVAFQMKGAANKGTSDMLRRAQKAGIPGRSIPL